MATPTPVPFSAPSREAFDAPRFQEVLRSIREGKYRMRRPAFARFIHQRAQESGLLRRLPMSAQTKVALERSTGAQARETLALGATYLIALEGALRRKDGLPSRPTPRALLLIDNAIRPEHPEAADRLWTSAGYKKPQREWLRRHPERVNGIPLPRLHEHIDRVGLVQAPDMYTERAVSIDPAIIDIGARTDDTRARPTTRAVVLDIDLPRYGLARGDVLFVRPGDPRAGQLEVRAGRSSWEIVAHPEKGGAPGVIASSGRAEERQRWGVVARTLSVRRARAS